MKPIRFSQLLGQSRTLRSFRFAMAAPAIALTLTAAQAGTPAAPTPAPAPTPASNWIGLTIGGAFVNGNDAGMMRRTQTNGDFYGGISDSYYAQDLGNSTTLTLDGHALPGLEDYEINARVNKEGLGYVKLGYDQFRTWYDGSGGYMPQLGSLYAEPAYGDDLHLDRGTFSFEAGLRMENLPEITLSYKHAFRNGDKDSTSWGDRQDTTNGNTTGYKFTPSQWNIDETTDTIGLDAEHTIGNTDLGLGLTFEHTAYTNTLSYSRGTVTPGTASAVNPAYTKNTMNDTSKTDDYKMDLFTGNIHSVTRFNDQMWLTAGFGYSSINTNTNGWTRRADPEPGSTAAATYANSPAGGAEYDQFVGNLNFMWTPIADLTVTPSLRIQQSTQSAVSSVANYNTATGLPTVAGFAYNGELATDETTAALDVRYNGISDLVLYARGEWGYTQESSWYRDVYTNVPPQPAIAAGAPSDWMHNELDADTQKYILGANWYPVRNLSFSAQGLYSETDRSYNPTAYNGPGGGSTLRPVMMDLDSNTDDFNLRMTWRPMGNVSLVTRYDYTETEYNNRGARWSPTANAAPGSPPNNPPSVPSATSNPSNGIWNEVQSSNITANILSQSVTWSPLDRLYLQGSVSFTWAQTDTNTAIVPDSDNDYVTLSLSAGYAIDDRTDITASYSYYGASNYAQQGSPVAAVGANSIPYGMGYGLNTQEHAANLSLRRMINENMIWNLSYGFMTSQTSSQDQSGGFNDFTAQMISTGLQIRF